MSEQARLRNSKLDVRVRARHMESGALSSDEISQHLANLPDLESQLDIVRLEQPALGGVGGMAPGIGASENASGEEHDPDGPGYV